MDLFNLHFTNTIFLYLLPFVLILFWIFNHINNRKQSIEVDFFDDLKKIYKFSNFYYYFKILLISLIIVVFFLLFANPNKINIDEKIKKDGIDIVLALDVSKSMDASDLQPNRIEAAKKVIDEFLDKLKTDRLGLVIFAGKPFSSIPLTFDYDILKESVLDITTDSLNQNVSGLDGTAIGDSLLMSKNLFENASKDDVSVDREKVVLLLTDGDANRGVDPILGAKLLAENNIKVYSIGIGSKEGGYINYNIGPFSQKQLVPPLNEDTLRKISAITKADFYRAVDNEALESIFNDLSALQKKEVEVNIKKTYSENYKPFVYVLIFLFLILFGIEFKLVKN